MERASSQDALEYLHLFAILPKESSDAIRSFVCGECFHGPFTGLCSGLPNVNTYAKRGENAHLENLHGHVNGGWLPKA